MSWSTTRSFTRRRFLTTATATAAGLMAAPFPSASLGSQGAVSDQERFRVIDVHVHVFDVSMSETNGMTIAHQIERMNRGGVDKGFLITYGIEDMAPFARSAGVDTILEASNRMPHFNRKYQVQAWKENRERFWWFPDSISPLRESYLDDLQKDFYEGASGIKLLPIFHGFLPDHPGWRPVYDLCHLHRKPIILDLSYWYLGPDRFTVFNESRKRQQMVESWQSWRHYGELLEPIFNQYSRVPFCLAHAGTARNRADYDDIFRLISRHPNVCCEISAFGARREFHSTVAFLETLVKAVGADKVLYGTDSPYWTGSDPDGYRTGSFRVGLVAEDGHFLSDEEKQLILAGNAERLVRFELP